MIAQLVNPSADPEAFKKMAEKEKRHASKAARKGIPDLKFCSYRGEGGSSVGANLKLCSSCKTAAYCSVDCQKDRNEEGLEEPQGRVPQAQFCLYIVNPLPRTPSSRFIRLEILSSILSNSQALIWPWTSGTMTQIDSVLIYS